MQKRFKNKEDGTIVDYITQSTYLGKKEETPTEIIVFKTISNTCYSLPTYTFFGMYEQIEVKNEIMIEKEKAVRNLRESFFVSNDVYSQFHDGVNIDIVDIDSNTGIYELATPKEEVEKEYKNKKMQVFDLYCKQYQEKMKQCMTLNEPFKKEIFKWFVEKTFEKKYLERMLKELFPDERFDINEVQEVSVGNEKPLLFYHLKIKTF